MKNDDFNGMRIYKNGVIAIEMGSNESDQVENKESSKTSRVTLENNGDYLNLTVYGEDTVEVEVFACNYEPCHFCGNNNDGAILLGRDQALQLANAILERCEKQDS